MANEKLPTTCRNCGTGSLYRNVTPLPSAGQGIQLLPGLGRFLHFAELRVVVCSACGLIQLFAPEEEARAKLPKSKQWRKVRPE
jgi:hypothetical protein